MPSVGQVHDQVVVAGQRHAQFGGRGRQREGQREQRGGDGLEHGRVAS
ncbi:MAG: hypothetical protein HY020_03490 [Burkholderiales bacterium]|nr:hypothetical protein [Burkholderiales bacterium]